MNDNEVLDLFRSVGALLNGHFVLTSGRHSDTYFEKFDVLRHPDHVETLCAELALRAQRHPEIGQIDVVVGPTTLGIVLAYEVAKQLGVPAAYAEKDTEPGVRKLRRPAHLVSGQRVLVVDDVLTTGGSIRECTALVNSCGAETVGVGVLVDRSDGQLDLGAPVVSTLSMVVKSWDANELPPELAAIEAHRPGSTGKS